MFSVCNFKIKIEGEKILDEKKFAIIIHKTDEKFFSELLDSLEQLEVPEGYDAEVLPGA